MGSKLRKKLRMFLCKVRMMRLWTNIRAMALANNVVGIIVVLFLLGSVGSSALVMLASSNWTGVDANVKTVFTVAVPTLSAVAIMLYILPRRS